MGNGKQDLYYGDYLKVPSLLGLQEPKSAEMGDEAHDETLFIIVHQVYELWFKQIIHELKSITAIFSKDFVKEESLSIVLCRLQRINKIQGLLVNQLEIIETMTPMDFLEFRDLLIPASGFQSAQFREIETVMGLFSRSHSSQKAGKDLGSHLFSRLSPKDRKHLEDVGKAPSMLELLDKWLERTPFLIEKGFNFWKDYRPVVQEMLDDDRKTIENNAMLDEKEKAIQVKNIEATAKTFESLFDSRLYEKQLEEGTRSLSQKAMLGALFILLYRENPLLSVPSMIIASVMDFDEGLTAWRYRHALMVHRMLGTKIGTGGSSGHHYLKASADRSRIFSDLFDLASFIIPKSKLPPLPEELKARLHFAF
ncbi:MAG: tryptophan 2,3-dioxygenase family protein [Bacteriovoracales bacterium]|nr:tryptophan 2,3-dioxygenase family protein [Bacteriovoracales bacterium]